MGKMDLRYNSAVDTSEPRLKRLCSLDKYEVRGGEGLHVSFRHVLLDWKTDALEAVVQEVSQIAASGDAMTVYVVALRDVTSDRVIVSALDGQLCGRATAERAEGLELLLDKAEASVGRKTRSWFRRKERTADDHLK